ncbi:MAG TPA: phosphopantetheine-binding protein, partial [Thermoanaerobaculia bacterium]|nr:phosphopantetheine-binding protein [Thermoanaerobaculia bacterium]
GAEPQVRGAAEILAARGIASTALGVTQGFHSRLVEPILGDLRATATAVAHHPPRIPWISNLTGRPMEARDSAANWAEYWVEQARQPVRFAAGMEALRDAGCRAFLEIGPKPVLIGMGRDCLDGEEARRSGTPAAEYLWLASLQPPRDERGQMLGSLGSLFTAGFDVDWQGLHPGRPWRRAALPTYPFERERFWIEPIDPQGSRHRARQPAENGRSRQIAAAGTGQGSRPAASLLGQFQAAADAERSGRLDAYLREAACEIMLYPPDKPLDLHQPLHDLGFDSIMAVRFSQRLRTDLAVEVPVAVFLEEPTLRHLSELVLERLKATAEPTGENEKTFSSPA